MEPDARQRNSEERERLVALITQMTKAELLREMTDGWTVAAKLAHIGFWDRFALSVLDRWASHQSFRIDVPDWYDDILNDAVRVEALALDPAEAARLAVEATSDLDARLAGLSGSEADRLAADAERAETDAHWLLHRYRHRSEHLDEIESALRQTSPSA